MAITEARFHLHIPAVDYVAYYRGGVNYVLATTPEGVRVQFPARLLRPFVTREGVIGDFVLRYDGRNKVVGLEKVSG